MTPLDALGLTAETVGPVTIPLADDVVLTARVADSLDIARARTAVVGTFDALDLLRTARQRYGLTEEDRAELADPATWEGIGEFVVMVELAAIVVSRIERQVAGQVLTVAPSVLAFSQLFRRADNLDRFRMAMKEGERQLVRPKAPPAPSPAGSGAAAPSTAGDAAI